MGGKTKIRMEYYEAGHMMYVHIPSLDRLVGHMRDFVKEPQ